MGSLSEDDICTVDLLWCGTLLGILWVHSEGVPGPKIEQRNGNKDRFDMESIQCGV